MYDGAWHERDVADFSYTGRVMRICRTATQVALAALAGMGVVDTAGAQKAATSYSFGIGAGWALPKGVFGDGTRAGYEVSGQVLVLAPGAPIGLRFDGSFDHFRATPGLIDLLPTATSGSAAIGALTLDMVAGTPNGKGFHPYAMGGAGGYLRHVEVYRTAGTAVLWNEPFWGFSDGAVSTTATHETDTQLRFGVNYGVGFSVGIKAISLYAEARYHIIYTSDEHTNMLPITLGLRF
jgi:hypothetical protein